MINLLDRYGKTIKLHQTCSRFNMGYWSDNWTIIGIDIEEGIVDLWKNGHGIVGNFASEVWVDEPAGEFFTDELI